MTLFGKKYIFYFSDAYKYDVRGKKGNVDAVIFGPFEGAAISIAAVFNPTPDQHKKSCELDGKNAVIKIHSSVITKYECQYEDATSIKMYAKDGCGKNCMIDVLYYVISNEVDWKTVSQLESRLIDLSQSSLDRL